MRRLSQKELNSDFASLRFMSVIKIQGVNPYVHVSTKQAQKLRKGWRRPMPVLIRINGRPTRPWRINMIPTGKDSFYLYLHEKVRKASQTKVGHRVLVELRFDKEYRNGPLHPMPRLFREALAKNIKAKTYWQKLSPSRKKEILRCFACLKSNDAKARNIEKAIQALSGTEIRFLGRKWTTKRPSQK
jgi:hypothetical protein